MDDTVSESNIDDYVQLTESGGNTTVQVDTNGGGDEFQAVAVLIGVTEVNPAGAV